ncbi:hypothetical protein HXA31_20515 [Salipaludibacillus agaradhaerens]|jgi:hypothetical protein|uniref:Uncharacterized protein n=1 Tax=Salipaludibacillus agaradhaerens TaxID=76935 RepID=A0A9Q4FZ93_SALAG|nr:hypothetical protein [Salipaludibacillus agaradhaerens]MCR6096872.1 hypothetical protein [Salipaludibacillus agaradhaerens]MCR6116716.1 hypothetical protein [Salipaludibacillus agaradhaerens]
MVIYEIEYEIPPLRAIYSHGVGAVDEETAVKKFKANNPRAEIRKVKVRQEY